MDFSGGSSPSPYYEETGQRAQAMVAGQLKVPTMRERLETKLAVRRKEVADLEAALTSLTPEFEAAFDALARVGHF